MPQKNSYDVIVIGAGAAGLMCALTAGNRGRRVLVLDHAKKPAEKIRISGGGRCNFTNIHASPAQFLSQNPHFCVSALKRYTPAHFLQMVEKHRIAYHEKTLGQLFCDGSSQQVIAMLLAECAAAQVEILLETPVASVANHGDRAFTLSTARGEYHCQSLVIATGGLSIPKMGATGFGYAIAQQFGLTLTPTRAGLVPFTLEETLLASYRPLSGIAIDPVTAGCGKTSFREAMLFTHRGLSGPAILQISSYWREGESVTLDLLPEMDGFAHLKTLKTRHPKQELHTVLTELLPKRLAQQIAAELEKSALGEPARHRLADLSHQTLQQIAERLHRWRITPSGTEGYRTAEVTLGGVDTAGLSSQTMEARGVPGLYFIGEVVDVTGWLGGYNFQWAWASGHAAGQAC